MKQRSLLLATVLLTSTGALVVGYGSAGYWLILAVIPVTALLWLVIQRHSIFWAASSVLLVIFLLAAQGLASGLSFSSMLISSTMALASWDLVQFNQSLAGSTPDMLIVSLEKHHIRSLAIVVFAGLLLVFLASMIDLQLPFGVIVLLVLTAMGGFFYGIRHITTT